MQEKSSLTDSSDRGGGARQASLTHTEAKQNASLHDLSTTQRLTYSEATQRLTLSGIRGYLRACELCHVMLTMTGKRMPSLDRDLGAVVVEGTLSDGVILMTSS